MSQPEKKKLVTPVTLTIDVILMIVFFIYMYSVMSTHVPSTDPKQIMIWGLYTSACMTGVFWLALQMFWVTFRTQREGKK